MLLLGGCLFNAPPPKEPAADPELAQETAAARLAFQRGANEQAITLYRRALDRARVMDDAGEIGKAAYNLAAALVRAGQYDAARGVLREAEAETLRAGVNAADVLLLEAKVAHLQDEPTDALVLADRVLTEPTSKPDDAHRLQVHVLRGEVGLDLNQRDLAQSELARAQKLLGGGDNRENPALRAAVQGLGARVSQTGGDPAKAAAGFDRQAEGLRQAYLYRDMARALSRAGGAYRDAGRSDLAADRLYRAARSFHAQDDAAEARRLIDAALSLAQQTNDTELIDRIRVLRKDLVGPLPPATGQAGENGGRMRPAPPAGGGGEEEAV